MNSIKSSPVARKRMKRIAVAVALAASSVASFAATGEEQGSQSSGFIGNFFHKTGSFFSNTWDKTRGLFTPHEGRTAATPYEPQSYGRAGGYSGSDRVEVLAGSPRTYAAGTTAVRSGEAPVDRPLSARANSTVDTRDMAGNRDTMTGSARDNRNVAPSATSTGSATDDSGRTAGRRFDHPDSAHGQMENETQSR